MACRKGHPHRDYWVSDRKPPFPLIHHRVLNELGPSRMFPGSSLIVIVMVVKCPLEMPATLELVRIVVNGRVVVDLSKGLYINLLPGIVYLTVVVPP